MKTIFRNRFFPAIAEVAGGKLSWIAFILSATFLFQYLYLIRFFEIDCGPILFWISISTIFLSVFMQIVFETHKKYWYVILFEIIIINLLLHSIFQLPFNFVYGSDAYYDMGTLKSILSLGKIPFSGYIYSTTLWPVIHLFGASVFFCTGLNLQSTVKLVPFLIEFSLPILLFLLFRALTNNRIEQISVCLMATLFYVSIFNHIQFGSLFIRQTIAIPIIVMLVYAGFHRNVDRNLSLILLSIPLIIVLTISHHFSSFIFLIIAGVLWFSGNFYTNNKWGSLLIIVLASVIIFAYWTFITTTVLFTMSNFARELLDPIATTYLDIASNQSLYESSLREQLIYAGFFIFNFIFGALIIIKRKNLKEISGFAFILFACGAAGLALFFTPLNIYPDRLLGYGWLFGALPLMYSIFSVNNITMKKILLVILLTFLLYNIYVITPFYYTNPYQNLAQPTFEDYSTTYKIDMSNGAINAYQNHELTITDVYQNRPIPVRYSINNGHYCDGNNGPYPYDYVVNNKKYIQKISSNLEYNHKYSEYIRYVNELNSTESYRKILDSNHVNIYQKI